MCTQPPSHNLSGLPPTCNMQQSSQVLSWHVTEAVNAQCNKLTHTQELPSFSKDIMGKCWTLWRNNRWALIFAVPVMPKQEAQGCKPDKDCLGQTMNSLAMHLSVFFLSWDGPTHLLVYCWIGLFHCWPCLWHIVSIWLSWASSCRSIGRGRCLKH